KLLLPVPLRGRFRASNAWMAHALHRAAWFRCAPLGRLTRSQRRRRGRAVAVGSGLNETTAEAMGTTKGTPNSAVGHCGEGVPPPRRGMQARRLHDKFS